MKELVFKNGDVLQIVTEYKGKQMRKLYAFRLRAAEDGFDFYGNFDKAVEMVVDGAKDKEGKDITINMDYLDGLDDQDFRKLNNEVNDFLVVMNNRLIEEQLKTSTDGPLKNQEEEKGEDSH
jgi:hypothetical protein